MADGTRMKEMQTQINLLMEIIEKRDAELANRATVSEAASNARLDRIETALEALAQQSSFSSSSHHGASNSFRDTNRLPFQVHNVKLEFPRFDGKHAIEWIFKAEQFFSYYDTPDADRLTIAAVHLDQEVIPWFQIMQRSNPFQSWLAFTRALELEFGPSAYDCPRATLFKLTQTGSVNDYYMEFTSLSNRVYGLSADALIFGQTHGCVIFISLFCRTAPTDTSRHLRVCDLMVPDAKVWNYDFILSFLDPGDVNAIASIPLSNDVHQDTTIWGMSRDGQYSVKSVYYCFMEKLLNYSSMYRVIGELFGNFKCPLGSSISFGDLCVIVSLQGENFKAEGSSVRELARFAIQRWIMHSIFSSRKVSQYCWQEVRMWSLIQNLFVEVDGFTDMVWRMLDMLEEKNRSIFVMVLWGLWKCRNDKDWEHKDTQPAVVVLKSKHELFDWLQSRRRDTYKDEQTLNAPVCRWMPPPVNFMKCNVDAAFFHQDMRYDAGMCIRDDKGNFFGASTCWFIGYPKVHEAEIIGILIALQWLMALNFDLAIIETGCKLVADRINGYGDDFTEFGVLLQDCKHLLHLSPNFHVRFVKRQANLVAHALAKVSNLYACSFFFEDVPPCIAEIFYMEMI